MYTTLKYNLGINEDKNWIVSETEFNPKYLGKCETIMSTGNGYLGLRAALEESYTGEVRNLFVAGTFNKANENEVAELPNAADITRLNIEINGENFSLITGKIKNYRRDINVRTGEVIRDVTWISPKGDEIEFTFRRFVSLQDLHLIGQKIEITAINGNLSIKISSGIDGRMTNSGAQHFEEGDKRLYHNKYIQLTQKTTESKIDFVLNTVHNFSKEPKKSIINMDRRRIFYLFDVELNEGESITIEKISNVYTSRDKDVTDKTLESLKHISLENIKKQSSRGYDVLLKDSINQWQTCIWDNYSIEIDTENEFDQLAIRFANYHLTLMTPAHDNRMNIGAKGFSGEGYKGHTFWDTEIFILPFFTYTNPKVARSLLEYRYLSLPGAHKKAKENGYEGAMFPWESAWLKDGEVTPVCGAANIITGEPEKIWSGFIEIHITSDVTYGTWQYFKVTNDQDFMNKYGYELIMDTAKFWQSRLEWKEDASNYQITDIIGPDEYKEHVDNNAYTNYLAYWNIKLAMKYYNELKRNNIELFNKLNDKLELNRVYKLWEEKVDKIFLPKAREDLVIPQDDTYLSLEEIDLTKYKEMEGVSTIQRDYNIHQLSQIQVSKQADLLVLFYLLEDLFDAKTKRINFNYYETRCLHDSSLSLSTHSILASDLGKKDMAYELFKRAAEIDLGPNMKSSDSGIHAASIGGMWQCIVNGFGGIRMIDGELRIEPNLPEAWNSFKFPLNWHGERLEIEVTKESFTVKNITSNKEVEFIHSGEKYLLKGEVTILF